MVAGNGALTAGPNGVALGIFGWADPALGVVSNVFTAGFAFGFVLPVFNSWNWQRVYTQFGPPFALRVLRAGLPVVLAAIGNFMTKFAQGGQAGSRVWADPATGLAYGANNGLYVPTPWTLMQSGGCNSNLRISSFSQPFQNLT